MEEKQQDIKKFLDLLGGICAFLTVAVYALLIINASWEFLPLELYNVLVVCRTWAPLVVVAITGFEFTRGRSLIMKILFYVLVAAVIVSMFFPDTWNEFVGIINEHVS